MSIAYALEDPSYEPVEAQGIWTVRDAEGQLIEHQAYWSEGTARMVASELNGGLHPVVFEWVTA